ncbi:hypothetical protein [Nocardia iowensis]|uniref:Uncharacterized protein n=1 Tax=Nocardia iowensis TaxID=204891 RepID=A0ABX8RN52_NOCIO|nr:hypothetical protein [Nocardia iowensis]QXN91059.1 hypothetical protein KV110_37900 [Nocardia iowensis]
MDSEDFTYLPDAVIDADGSLVEQLNNGALRKLVRTAAGLSMEAQHYLAVLANRLRASEGLHARNYADGEK